jgi:hypothetical protein
MLNWADSIPWGGCSQHFNFVHDRALCWDGSIVAPDAHAPVASALLPAQKINKWTPWYSYESLMLGGVSPASILLSRLFSSSYFTQANLPYLWPNMIGKTATFNSIIYRNPSGINAADVRLQFRGTALEDAQYFESAGFAAMANPSDFVKQSLTIPNTYDWATYNAPGVALMIQRGQTTVNNEILIATMPWIETEDGLILHTWSQSGRSVGELVDNTLIDPAIWSTVVPLYGTERILWIDIGTNNPDAHSVAEHKAHLTTLINNFRAGTASGHVLITTDYRASTDAVGANTYYADASEQIAAETPGVLCLNTQRRLPEYADGVALGYYGDTIHYNDTGRQAYVEMIETMLQEADSMAGNKVAFSFCPGGTADQKGAITTVDISSGVATFDAALTSVIAGVGMEIAYNDGVARKAYIAPAGKITTSQWRVTTAIGGLPPNCVGAAVSSINHPYSSMFNAEAGCTDANHINNTSLVAADVDCHLVGYCEQAGYTADTTAGMIIDGITTDATHKLYVYCPTDTATECNLSMFPTTPVWDDTKYRYVNANTQITKSSTVRTDVDIHHMQIRQTDVSTTARFAVSVSTANGETVNFYSCIVRNAAPTTTGARTGLRHATGSTGILNAFNNIFIFNGSGVAPTAAGACQCVNGTMNIYQNTIVGHQLTVNRNGGTAVMSNNLCINNVAATSGAVTKDYDTYDVDHVEVNGTLTAQTPAQIFTAAAGNRETWNFRILNTSDAIGAGTNLGAGYDGDMFHAAASGWRVGQFDCGAIQRRLFGTITLVPNNGSTAGGTTVTITDTVNGITTGFVATFGGTAATGETAIDHQNGTAITPVGVGTVDVVVTNSDGEAVTLVWGYTYNAPSTSGALKSTLCMSMGMGM